MGVLAIVAIAILGYTYFGYPILIGTLARLAPWRPPRRDPSSQPWLPFVSALIPVYNAATYLPAKLDSLLAQDWPADRLEILVYSDGATDDTEAVARAYADQDPRVRLVRGGARAGKPTAINRMLAVARGEVLLMTDVRQPLDPTCLCALINLLRPAEVGCVSGNLTLPTTAGAGVYWQYESWLREAEASFRSMLGVTGPIYVIRKTDLPALPVDTILDDMWIPLRLRLAGRRLLFAKEAIAHDRVFEDEREFGRKVRTLAGLYQLMRLLPALLSPITNPSWFEFVSHKVLRLLCPFALLTLLAVLPMGWTLGQRSGAPETMMFGVAALAQLGFYALALLGGRAGKLGTVARTFVVLNAATLVGLWRHLRGAQRVTW